MKNTKMKELLQKLGTLMALAILVLIFCITMPDKFMKVGNFMNILKQASINCLIASGMLCALITAGIDLSVGSNCVLCTCTIGVMVQSGITNPFLLALCGLAPTGTDTGADTIGERIGTAHQPGADTQEFLGGRTGGTEARRDHAAG